MKKWDELERKYRDDMDPDDEKFTRLLRENLRQLSSSKKGPVKAGGRAKDVQSMQRDRHPGAETSPSVHREDDSAREGPDDDEVFRQYEAELRPVYDEVSRQLQEKFRQLEEKNRGSPDLQRLKTELVDQFITKIYDEVFGLYEEELRQLKEKNRDSPDLKTLTDALLKQYIIKWDLFQKKIISSSSEPVPVKAGGRAQDVHSASSSDEPAPIQSTRKHQLPGFGIHSSEHRADNDEENLQAIQEYWREGQERSRAARVHRHSTSEISLFERMRACTLQGTGAWKRLMQTERQLTKAFLADMADSKEKMGQFASKHTQAVTDDVSLNEDTWIQENSGIARHPYQVRSGLQILMPFHDHPKVLDTPDLDVFESLDGLQGLDESAVIDHAYVVATYVSDFWDQVIIPDCTTRESQQEADWAKWALESFARQQPLWRESEKNNEEGFFRTNWDFKHEGKGYNAEGIVYLSSQKDWATDLQLLAECLNISRIKNLFIHFRVFSDQIMISYIEMTVASVSVIPQPLMLEDSVTTCRVFEDTVPARLYNEDSITHKQTVAVLCKPKQPLSRDSVIQRIFALQLGTAKRFWQHEEGTSDKERLPLLTVVPKSSRCWFHHDLEGGLIAAKVKTVASVRDVPQKAAEQRAAAGKAVGGAKKKQGRQAPVQEEPEEPTTRKLLIVTTYLIKKHYNSDEKIDISSKPPPRLNTFADPVRKRNVMFAPFAWGAMGQPATMMMAHPQPPAMMMMAHPQPPAMMMMARPQPPVLLPQAQPSWVPAVGWAHPHLAPQMMVPVAHAPWDGLSHPGVQHKNKTGKKHRLQTMLARVLSKGAERVGKKATHVRSVVHALADRLGFKGHQQQWGRLLHRPHSTGPAAKMDSSPPDKPPPGIPAAKIGTSPPSKPPPGIPAAKIGTSPPSKPPPFHEKGSSPPPRKALPRIPVDDTAGSARVQELTRKLQQAEDSIREQQNAERRRSMAFNKTLPPVPRLEDVLAATNRALAPKVKPDKPAVPSAAPRAEEPQPREKPPDAVKPVVSGPAPRAKEPQQQEKPPDKPAVSGAAPKAKEPQPQEKPPDAVKPVVSGHAPKAKEPEQKPEAAIPLHSVLGQRQASRTTPQERTKPKKNVSFGENSTRYFAGLQHQDLLRTALVLPRCLSPAESQSILWEMHAQPVRTAPPLFG